MPTEKSQTISLDNKSNSKLKRAPKVFTEKIKAKGTLTKRLREALRISNQIKEQKIQGDK